MKLDNLKDTLRKREPLESITVYDMRAYIRHKQDSGLKTQSIVSMAKMIKAFLNWCVKEEYLKESPMKKLELPKPQKKVLKGFTVEEVYNMINSFSSKSYLEARNRAILSMMADCGLRSMEIRNLSNNNVNDTTLLVDGKGNKQRFVSISPVLKRILIQYERQKRLYFKNKMVKSDKYLLTYKGDDLSHMAVYNVIKEAGERAGVTGKRVSPHSLRHFYSVQSLLTGHISVFELSRLLGHSNVQITQNYLQSMTDQELLNKAVSSSPLMNLNK
jgi:integrase/recombinase XerD